MKRLLIVLVALGGCECAHPYTPPALSPDAELVFSRADEPGAGGSLVVDVEQARLVGLVQPDGRGLGALTDMALYLLPGVAAQMPNEPTGKLAARSAVLLGLLRDWAGWPHVQRFGLLVPAPSPGEGLDAMVAGVTLVVAVHQSKAESEKLLQGIAALDRASGQPLLRSAGEDLCYAVDVVGGDVCVSAGEGYFAASSPEGLRSLMPGKGAPRPKPLPPALLRLRADVPLMGSAALSLSGTTSVKLDASVTTTDPKLAEAAEKTVNDYLARLDQNRAATRAIMKPELEQTQAALQKDAAAPADLKAVAGKMTLDQLLDPSGSYRALRESIHVTRADKEVSVTATFPEPMVKEVTRDSGLLTTVAMAGIVAAVAVPSFTKYQCKSKQSEAKAVLAAIGAAQRAFQASHDHAAKTFDELGYAPPQPAGYTYCVAGGCVACTAPGCPTVDPADNFCTTRAASLGPDDAATFSCAIGDPAGAGDPNAFDVWFTFAGEQPMNVQNGCD